MQHRSRRQGAKSWAEPGYGGSTAGTLLETALKQEAAYGDFLLEVVSTEVEAGRQRY